jgi:hypothetical protein
LAEQKEALDGAFGYGENDKGVWGPGNTLLTVREFKAHLDRVAEHKKREAERKAAQQKQRVAAKDAAKEAPEKSRRDSSAAVKAKREAADRRAKEQRAREQAASVAVFEAIVGKVKDISGAVLDMLIEQEFQQGDCGHEEYIARLFGWEAKADARYGQVEKLYQANRAKLSTEQKAKLFVALRSCIDVDYGPKQLDAHAERLKLDPKKIRAAAMQKAADAQKKQASPKAEQSVAPAVPKKAAKGKAAGKAGRK